MDDGFVAALAQWLNHAQPRRAGLKQALAIGLVAALAAVPGAPTAATTATGQRPARRATTPRGHRCKANNKACAGNRDCCSKFCNANGKCAVKTKVQFVTQWGAAGTGDGQFRNPTGIAAATRNNNLVYVADALNQRIQFFDTNGTYVGQFGAYGTGNGQFQDPVDLAVDGYTDLAYVIDDTIPRLTELEVTATTLAYSDKISGQGSDDYRFRSPAGVAVDLSSGPTSDYVYVADTGNNRIVQIDDRFGWVTTWTAFGASDRFDRPVDVAVGAGSTVYVVDQGHNRVVWFDHNGAVQGSWDGSDSGQAFDQPSGIDYDLRNDVVYVADTNNHRIVAFDQHGAYLFQWGANGTGTGEFKSPQDVAVNAQDADFVYVADTGNNRIQKFTVRQALP